VALSAGAVAAQEEERETGWFDEAEVSLVATDGNSQSATFSLRNTLRGVFGRSDLKITSGGLRAATTDVQRSAVGTSPEDAQFAESSTTAVTAERYYFEGRYRRRISDRWYWYAALGWERNEPAGIANRSSVAAGAGNRWLDRKKTRFHTDYALTYTEQDDLVQTSGGGFAGLRFTSDFWRRLTATTEFANQFTVDVGLEGDSDVRGQMFNSLSVRMSERLALKLSHELQFDSSPSLIAVPIVTPTGEPVDEDLLVEAEEVDTTVSLALVVGF